MPRKNNLSSSEIFLARGDILFSEGDPIGNGYIMASGELVLYTTTEGRRTILERRGPGSIVGELSILTGNPRTVTVEASQPCILYEISAKQILHRYAKIDPILRACIETSIYFSGRLNADLSGEEETPITEGILPELDQLVECLKFEHDILLGLANDQFSLVYQPIVSLPDGDIVGVEALMRWHHPTAGNIPPGKFIEAAESMGAICQLTDFALLEACAALKRLRSLGQCSDDFFICFG